MIKVVVLTLRAQQDPQTVPRRVLDKLEAWIRMVEMLGVEEVRRISGFHDGY